jgi:hypothetical protein
MSVGRPSKYDPKFCELLMEHMKRGLSFLSFAGTIGICFDTLYEWEKQHPEFSEAKKRGVAMSLAWDEELLNKGSEGKQRGYNAAAHKWKMTNRYKWSDRTEVLSKDAANLNIEDLKREAAELLAKLED